MNFYQNIEPFVEYLHSIRKVQDYISIDILLPTKWSLTKNIKEIVEVVPFKHEDEHLKGISLVCKLTDEDISKAIDALRKVIKLNKERELKELLFKQTIEELKKTFEQNDLEKLQNLYFDFSTEVDDTSNLENYDTGQPEVIELAE